MEKEINASIVLYNSDYNQINFLVNELKANKHIKQVYLIDNSPFLNKKFENCNAIYIFNNMNLGYGSAHNLAIEISIKNNTKYHLVINPDIIVQTGVLDKLMEKLDANKDIGLIMPKILNSNGTVQLLPKLLPNPLDLLIRVFKPLTSLFINRHNKYILKNYSDSEINSPIISGCFSLFRVNALKEVGLYDETFFMYFEDFDLSRRVHMKYQTLYYPKTHVIHAHERGAAKNLKLFFVFINSAILYFNKYGWFIDKERSTVNESVIKQLR